MQGKITVEFKAQVVLTAMDNIVSAVGDSPKLVLCWTEDNRLQAFMERGEDGDIAAGYNYTAGGERNFKITSTKLRLRQNAAGLRYAAIMKYPTLYASALVTFNRGGYTKHYFEGTSRICSKIGGGFSDVEWNRTIERVPEMQDDYSRLSERQSESVHQTFEQCFGIGVAMEGVADLYDVIKKEHERDEKEPAFYYHSDHLGSAAYLTNDDGKVTQTLNYLPYGEDWVDVRNDLDPRLGQYTFNGKEKDHESGFHYYGARYYWSELLTGWLSVDPLADKYPSFSPYNYCMWNPVKLVDPDGRDVWESDDRWQYNTTTGRLTWINDDGGMCRQTVEMVHNQGDDVLLDQTISYSGSITEMFDCSVVSPTIDRLIGGGMDMATGVAEASAGLALGCGISAVSMGMAAPAAMAAGGALVAAGGYQTMSGFRDIMSTIDGSPNGVVQYNFMREACKAGMSFGASLLKSGRQGLKGALGGLVVSVGWSYAAWRSAAYPEFKGIPSGATINK